MTQHAFTEGKPCLTNSLSFYNIVVKTTDIDEDYDMIYLDFSKSLDKVPHYRLLLKLHAHGVDGKVLS